jgi:hypothetical protein
MTLCECCDEKNQHVLCAPYCEECARPQTCSRCDCELANGDNADWSPENQVACLCESCRIDDERAAEFAALVSRVETIISDCGWTMARAWSRAQTGSMYAAIERGDDRMTIRVSDHATCYCREDISIVLDGGSGDDHDIDALASMLA